TRAYRNRENSRENSSDPQVRRVRSRRSGASWTSCGQDRVPCNPHNHYPPTIRHIGTPFSLTPHATPSTMTKRERGSQDSRIFYGNRTHDDRTGNRASP